MRIRTLIQEVAASWTEYRKKGRVNKKSPPFFDRQIEIPYGCQRAARLADKDGKKRTTPLGACIARGRQARFSLLIFISFVKAIAAAR